MGNPDEELSHKGTLVAREYAAEPFSASGPASEDLRIVVGWLTPFIAECLMVPGGRISSTYSRTAVSSDFLRKQITRSDNSDLRLRHVRPNLRGQVRRARHAPETVLCFCSDRISDASE